MKKLVFIFLVLCAFSIAATAQNKKHEVTLGYGIGSSNGSLNTISDIRTAGLTAGTYSVDQRHSGAFHLGYKYTLSNRVSLGPVILYQDTKSKAFVDNTQTGRFDSDYFTLAAEVKYKYLDNGKFALYGLAGIGGTLHQQKFISCSDLKKDDSIDFNYQLTPIGIQYGSRVGVYAEAGFGYKELVCAGMFIWF